MLRLPLILLIWLMPLAGAAIADQTLADRDAEFETNVRPLLARHCYPCHGPEHQESELRLDHLDHILKGGDRGAAIIIGSSQKSLMVEAIDWKNPDLQMPPDGRMSADEIATVKRWIDDGAYWPHESPPAAGTPAQFDVATRRDAHWAWRPVFAPTVPEVERSDWPRSSIDHFVLSALEKAGLTPATDASRESVLRRASYDLVGLPPSPEQRRRFLADDSPQAFAKLVDELLASPQFGEKWGRHWLDLARYAETYGQEDNSSIPNAWRYRDYVIRALNADVPYNEFILEQVAGDLISPARRDAETGQNESVVGTGFFTLGEELNSPVDVDQARANRIDNQIEVMFKTFQALTVNCARCHDHKFDAISQRDYYAIAGIMQSSRITQRYVDSGLKVGESLKNIDAQLRQSVADSWLPVGANAAVYVQAARQLIEGCKPNVAVAIAPDAAVDVFGRDGYEGCRLEGKAFEHGLVNAEVFNTLLGASNPPGGPVLSPNAFGPVICSHQVGHLPGEDYAHAANFENASGKLTGTITSPDFRITHRFLHLQVGGGGDRRTAIEVEVDGKVIAQLHGREEHALRYVVIDLGKWLNLTARIRLIDDREDGAYAYIAASSIQFSDLPTPPMRRSSYSSFVIESATEKSLDPIRLARWVDALTEGAGHARAEPDADESDQAIDVPLSWVADGPAFKGGDGRNSTLFGSSPEHPVDALLPSNWKFSGAVARRANGRLMSSGFTIDRPYVHARVVGDEAQLNLRAADTTYSAPPVYERLKRHVSGHAGQSFWVTFPASNWLGRRGYLELIDATELDSIDAFRFGRPYAENGVIGIERVVLSNADQAPTEPDDEASIASRVLAEDPREVQSEIVAALAAWRAGSESEEQAKLVSYLARHDLLVPNADANDAGAANRSALFEMRADVERSITPAAFSPGLAEGDPIECAVALRGDVHHPGNLVPRRFLSAIAGDVQPPLASGSGRLELAHHLAAADNPLTARVLVNRIWQHLMGRGIVATPDNFGEQGAGPALPELLDHLATELIENGWSQKKLIREIMLSRTYQMSAIASNADDDSRDPQNELRHRANIRRLNAESIRDSMLSISGSLDTTMFGASVPIVRGANAKNKHRQLPSGPIDGFGRRSIYLEVDRNDLPTWFTIFDGPRPFTAIGLRDASNIPGQSLFLMNDPFVLQQSLRWAGNLQKMKLKPAEVAFEVHRKAYARDPNRDEIEDVVAFLERRRHRHAAAQNSDECELRALRDLCHAIFMTKEFIYLD